MSTFVIMAIIAILVLVLAYCHTRTAKTHSIAAVESINNTECMEAFVMVLAYTKAALKEERLSNRRARQRAWYAINCASKEAAHKARKERMSHISSAQRKAEATSKANQWMVGKSWQEAIQALYSEGKLVSVRSGVIVTTATMQPKKPKATKGTKFLVVKATCMSVSQKDMEYKSTHKVVGSKCKTAVTWSLWQKVVRKEVVAMLVWLKEEAKNDPYGYRVVANKVAA